MEVASQRSTAAVRWAKPSDSEELNWRQMAIRPSSLAIRTEPHEAQIVSNTLSMPLRSIEPGVRSYDHWLTAGITWITAPDIPHIEPQIIVNPSARPFISDKVQDVINRLLPVLADTARRHYVFATKIELSGFVDPEEDAREVVITQWVKLSPQAALDYWDQLGRVLEFSSDSLPEELKTLADERLAIEVRWEANDRTP